MAMTSEVKMREAFAAKYQRDPDDPTSAEMLAVFSDGWEAARVEARAKALEEAAKECERIANEKWAAYKGRTNPVYKDNLYNPHTEGMSDGADHCAASIRSLAKEAP